MEEETAAVEPVAEAVEPTEDEPSEQSEGPEQAAEPGEEPEEPAAEATDPEAPAEPVVEPEEPVVEPEDPVEPTEPTDEPKAEKPVPFTVEWNDLLVVIEGAPEETDIRVRSANKVDKALQQLTEEEAVETLFAMSLSRDNAKLDEKATVTVTGEALNDLPEDATLAEINKKDTAKEIEFEYIPQTEDEPASIIFQTSVLDRFALILPSEATVEPMGDEPVVDEKTDGETTLRGVEPYVADRIQKTWGQQNVEIGNGITYDWSIGWGTIISDSRDADYFNNRLRLHPRDWQEINGQIKVEIKVNPPSEPGTEAIIPAEAIEVILPRYIFYAWDDDQVNQNTYMGIELSLNGVPVGKNSFQNISTQQSGSINYYYQYETDADGNEIIVIRNWNAIASGTFSAEIGYKADPLQINGGHPVSTNPSATRNELTWFGGYTDYFTRDYPVTFRMDADKNGEYEVDYTGLLGIAVLTRIASSYRALPMPVGKVEQTANNTEHKSGVFLGWDSLWGEKPADADDYFYIVWNVNYGRGQHKLYPESYIGGNTFRHNNFTQGWEAMISAENADNTINVDGQIFQGEVIGMLSRTSMISPSLPYYAEETFAGNNSNNMSLKGLANGPISEGVKRDGYFRNVKTGGALDGQGWRDLYSAGIGYYQNGNHYAFLIRYPKSAIEAVGLEKMISDGLQVDATFRITETWDSGHVTHATTSASTRFSLDPTGEGSGIFKKSTTLLSTAGYGQTLLLNGENLDLNRATSSGGWYDASWVNMLSANAPSIGTTAFGQHIVMTDTKDSTLLISSSKAQNVNLFSASDTEILTEDDYQFNGFWFDYVKEYDADCVELSNGDGSSMYVWQLNSEYDTDFANQKPFTVYIRKRGSTDFEPYCAVYRTTACDKSEAFLWNGDVDANGLPVKGSRLNWSWGHYPVPDGTVQIRVEHDSDFYRCEVRFNVGVRLLSTEHVREIVQRHVDNGANTFIRNVTSYSVSPLYTEGLSSETISSLTRSGSNYVENGWAKDDTYTLTPLINELKVVKTYYTPDDSDPIQQAATHEDKQISYILLHAVNETDMQNSFAITTDYEDPYKLLKGTFYELLPKGTFVQPGSIFGYYSLDYWHETGGSTLQSTARNYLRQKEFVGRNWEAGHWFVENTEFTYKTTPNYKGTGRTMLEINYEIEDPRFNLNYAPSTRWWCDVYFYFIMENPTDNIGTNGNNTPNPIGFVNRTENGIAITGDGFSLDDAGFDPETEKPAFTDIDANNEQVAFGETTIIWNAVTTTETGFSKAVRKLMPDTVNDIETSVYYKSQETVMLGKDYMYRLRYRTESGTRADSIVFYDILESGVAGENGKTSADWRGTFVSVDTSEIESKVSVTSETGATCAPVVYYSTTLVCKNSENGDYFDLTDSSNWTTERPSGKVTAIAVDCSKDTDGEAFTIGPDDTMYVYIQMTAPSEYTEGEVYNGAVVSARPHFGGSGESGNSGKSNTRAGDEGIKKLRHEASVLLLDLAVELHKASNPKTGTPEARTQVKADGTGTIVYRLTVRNDMPFDAENVVVSDPIPEGLTVDHVTVKLNGASEETDASATNGFTYEQSGQTCTFTIAKQYPTVVDDTGAVTSNKDTEIYIYTTVDSLLKDENDPNSEQVLWRNYDNTATLVSANGKEINEPTETMYHRAETTLIPVEKIWDDDNDRDGLRPTTIDVTLTGKAGEDTVVTETTTLDKDHDWKGKFENLPKYDIDDENTDFDVPTTYTEIVYTLSEEQVEDYEKPVIDNENHTITNKHIPEVTEVSANKKWKNADGTAVPPQGAKVTYTLYADGVATQYKVELKGTAGTAPTTMGGYESEAWTASFVNLPKYRDHGTEIVYTIAETVTYPGYTPSTTQPVANGGTITNTQDVTQASANKKWKNADGTVVPPQGAKVTYTLYADGVATQYTVELKGAVGTAPTVTGGYESEAWTAKFVNLPKFKAGTTTEIVYTIAETVTYPGYTPSTTQPVANGGTITNTQETTEISANKKWKNADGTTTPPEGAKVTYTLYADGTATEYTVELKGEAGSTAPTVTGGYERVAWTAKFVNLPKFKAGTDTEIVYTIGETVTYPGYTPDKTEPVANGETITNEQDVTEASANKKWKNADGTTTPPAGAKVTYTLYADGVATAYKVELKGVVGTTPTATGGYESEAWTAKFVNLPKFKAGTTTEIVYTIAETVTYPGYTPSTTEPVANGGTITNTQDVTEVSANKAWKNADGTVVPPEGAKVTYTLYADGVATEYTVELKGEACTAPTVTGGYESAAWTAKFVNLPKFKAGTDTEIVYTIAETVTYGGYTPSTTEPVANGETITNVQDVTEVSAHKAWLNADETTTPPEGAKVTYTLYADGVATEYTVELKDEAGTAPTVTGGYESEAWLASFVNLPKFKAGTDTEIVYTIGETVTYPGYTPDKTEPVANGETITNVQEATEATVKKVWDDDDDRDGIRPKTLTLVLSNGTEVVLNEENGWTATVDHLPKIDSATGEEIEYTWTEKDLPEGYTLTDTSKEGTVTTLTNTHEPEKIELKVRKEWDDVNNRDRVRPSSITVTLFANGETVETVSITPDADGNWEYTFTDLNKYSDHGTEIKYTIEEEKLDLYVPEYEETSDGFKITNTYLNRNPRIVISGQKTWNDKNNYEGKRPSSITIRLYADGVEVNVATVTAADGWHYAFIDLPKFNDDGKEIVYTITEDEVYGYITEIHGYDVTNTFVVQTGDNAHPGLWITILSLAVLAGAAMLILERKSRKQRSN